LDDSRNADVTVQVNGNVFSLKAGKHLLITDKLNQTFAQINPVVGIGHRNFMIDNIASGLRVYTSDFSIPTAIETISPLNELMSSSNPQAVRITTHMLKTIAYILRTTGNVKYQLFGSSSNSIRAQEMTAPPVGSSGHDAI
jgi:hypothetical protein